MRRILAAAIILPSIAMAMPSDLPWEPFVCDDGKALDIKYLSDGLAIGVRLNGDDTRTLTLAPSKMRVIDALRAKGFFLTEGETPGQFPDGDYKGEGDTLLVLKSPYLTLTGTDVTGAPYENCGPAPIPKAG